MHALNNRDTARLRADLDAASEALREHAAEHAYRRDACRHIGERLLATYHHDRHRQVLGLAARLSDHQQTLSGAATPVPQPQFTACLPRPQTRRAS